MLRAGCTPALYASICPPPTALAMASAIMLRAEFRCERNNTRNAWAATEISSPPTIERVSRQSGTGTMAGTPAHCQPDPTIGVSGAACPGFR
jgi:hypothetical protein